MIFSTPSQIGGQSKSDENSYFTTGTSTEVKYFYFYKLSEKVVKCEEREPNMLLSPEDRIIQKNLRTLLFELDSLESL